MTHTRDEGYKTQIVNAIIVRMLVTLKNMLKKHYVKYDLRN